MSQSPTYPSYPHAATGPYTSYNPPPHGPFDPSTPPPPPPKPLTHEPRTPPTGPPLPPPPSANLHLLPAQHPTNEPVPSSPSNATPPTIEEGWLPSILKDKSTPDLQHLLSQPPLLHALATSPTTTHPSYAATLPHILSLLATNTSLATHLLTLHAQLLHQRRTTQTHLLQLHALEHQWRQKQLQMDGALAPFAPKALYQRLALGVGEAEGVCEAVEESFLEGEGEAGEREVGEFVKRVREGRKGVWLRRERKERWDEGRVGGWR